MCKLFGKSKQAYFKYNEESVLRKLSQEAFALEYIRNIRKLSPGIGGAKLWHMYKENFSNIDRVGRDRFEDIIHRNHLKVRNKVRKPKTTDSRHGLPMYPNLVRELIPERPNQLWVSDITYIVIWHSDTEYSFVYLSLIMDAYTHEIVGWSIGPTLETLYPFDALNMAIKRLKTSSGKIAEDLIHHSDRGCQYASRRYTDRLSSLGIQISMTENGDPKENAKAERINNTMKNELLKDMIFRTIEEVESAVKVAVDFYNNMRPHMSIDMMTPSQAAKCNGRIKKWWRSYREEAIDNKVAS